MTAPVLHSGVMAQAAHAGRPFGHVLWTRRADGHAAALITDPLDFVPATLLRLLRRRFRCDARPLRSIPLLIWTLLSSHDSNSFRAKGFHAFLRELPFATC